MTQIVDFMCDKLPTKEELREAIDYCAEHNCVARISYTMFGYVYHEIVRADNDAEDLSEYYRSREYGM